MPRGYTAITRVYGRTLTLLQDQGSDFIRSFPMHVSHDFSDISHPTPSLTERLFL